VADIATAPAIGSFPAYLTEYNGALYFSADDGKGTTGKELWKYDSTKPVDASNPSVVADIWIGQNGSNPAYLTKYGGWLYFSADDGTGKGVELLRYKNP
jgi:ELWxxDGT repeat protein